MSLLAEHEAWLPAFLHWYPGITPDTYAELDTDRWERLKAWIEAQTKGVRR